MSAGGKIPEFPSQFPIKVMGRHDSDLRLLIPTCAHAPAPTGISWR
jgi:putative lipoic acid-binding regulatory protein